MYHNLIKIFTFRAAKLFYKQNLTVMRNQALYAIVAMAALFFVNGCQKPVVEPPTLKLDTTEFSAKAEGEVVSVPYTLTNGVEGSEVSVNSAANYDWAEVTGVTATAIQVTVDPNTEAVSRTAEFTVSYPGVSTDCEFSITQDPGAAPAPEYDYELAMTMSSLAYYEGGGDDGEDNFSLTLSDSELDAEGYPQPGHVSYCFDIYTSAGTAGVLPAGTYTLGEEFATTAGTFSPTFSEYIDGTGATRYFSEGTVTVSESSGVYELDAVLTDEVGETHHVTYSGAIEAEVPEVPEYDYEFEMTAFSSYYYDSYGNNGEINYYTWISDLPFSDDGYTQVGGNYYLFDIFAAPGSGHAIPVGTYTLGVPGATDAGTFTPDYSQYRYQGADDDSTVERAFVSGSLEVSAEGDVYTFEAVLTDDAGETHHVVYTGPAVVEVEPEPEPEPEIPVIEEPVDMEASFGQAFYYNDAGGVMGVTFQFTDMDVVDGYVVPPGTLLTVEAYMPYNEDGKLALGTYEVNDTSEEYSVASGWGLWGYNFGTYAVNFADEENYAIGYITSGTMEIGGSRDFDQYTITCTFQTSENVSIECSWSGNMVVSGMPGPASTLEGDYTLNLEGATASASCYGDYYETGGANWTLQIMPEGAGDAISMDFVVEGLDESEIPSGTYKAAATEYPGPGEYLTGYVSGSYLYGTWYAGYDAEGYIVSRAPATSGDITVVNNGDGTYDLTFNCDDGSGNIWSGSWSGVIETGSSSMYAASSVSSGSSVKAARGMSAVKAPMTPEEKAEFVRENGLKIPAVSAVQVQKHTGTTAARKLAK